MSTQLRVTLITLFMLTSTLMLNSVLSIFSFEKTYISSLVSIYQIIGDDLKVTIEQGLRFGKPLQKYKGMDNILKEQMDTAPELAHIFITSSGRKILYHTDQDLLDQPLPDALAKFDKKKLLIS